MLKNFLYILKKTDTKISLLLTQETIHALLSNVPTIILLLILKELFQPIPDKNFIIKNIAAMTVIFAVHLIFARKVILNTHHFVFNITAKLKILLGNQLQKLPLGYLKNQDSADLASVVLQDVNNFESIVTHSIPNTIGAFLGFILLSSFLLYLDPVLSIILISGLPCAFIFILFSKKMFMKLSETQIHARDETAAGFIEYILGIQHLKAFNLTGKKFHSLEKRFDSLRRKSIKTESFSGPFVLTTFVVFEFFFMFMAYYGAKRITGSSPFQLTIPVFTAFLILGYRAYEPLKLLMADFPVLNYMNTSLERIIDLLDSTLQSPGQNLVPGKFDISFENVSFSYVDSKVLNDISFTIPEKKITAIAGPSGGGKTTITSLISRFYDTDNGSIKIGGINIRDISPENVCKLISQVFQDVYLFDDTIYNNIKIGNPEASERQIINALKKARVDEFTNHLPDGIHTRVGDAGTHLSGGQKQRVSIARSILKDSPIILLDEATASLDPENEIYIHQAIQELVSNKTVLVIAHRLQTIKNADKIIVLENGKISQEGKHQQLIEQKGTYQPYWNLQQHNYSWETEAIPQPEVNLN